MIIREVQAKSILSDSKVYPYVVNPYTGCQHACTYCYARFMKRFTHHHEPWGEFVDVKINAPELLLRQISKKKIERVWVSGVCDPYQPVERKYRLTRQCLEILADHGWPVSIQTRSPLVVRDIDILKAAKGLEVGLSVTTADDGIRRLFEPHAPPIAERLEALDELHKSELRTYVMVAPMLPGAAELAELLVGKVDYVIVDRMNYNHADWVYRKYSLLDMLRDEFFIQTKQQLSSVLGNYGIPVSG
ncbi:MAG: radical SAM protein [Anaerolineales bacterium]|nr:radical SAM protein [Anaerolineae bacterium]PWB53514.1 MAG: radical SAM protein [Anaerolineales bacterium]